MRRGVSTGAAILLLVKRRACALARRHVVLRIHDTKLVRANHVEVGNAACVIAVSEPSLRFYPHLDVVAVDETHVVVILFSDSELGECDWRNSAGAGTFENAAAVSCDAFTVAGGVEVAAGTSPEAASPSWRSSELYGSAWIQLISAVAEDVSAVPCESSGPDGVRAIVLQSEFSGGNSNTTCDEH